MAGSMCDTFRGKIDIKDFKIIKYFKDGTY